MTAVSPSSYLPISQWAPHCHSPVIKPTPSRAHHTLLITSHTIRYIIVCCCASKVRKYIFGQDTFTKKVVWSKDHINIFRHWFPVADNVFDRIIHGVIQQEASTYSCQPGKNDRKCIIEITKKKCMMNMMVGPQSSSTMMQVRTWWFIFIGLTLIFK